MATALQTSTGAPVVAQTPNQIAAIQAQLQDLTNQKTALGKYGLTDTNQLIKDQYGAYVPKPAPTPVGQTPPGGTSPTVADVYGGVYSPDPQAAARTAAEAGATAGYTAGAPNQKDTYTNALNEYQDQIDAINNLYATKRADVTNQYTDLENGRMGSESALLANTGMAGNSFGESQTNNLQKSNTQELQGAQDKVDADKAAAIASVMGQVRQQASTDYQTKLDAYTKGANSTIQFLNDAATRNSTNIKQTAQNAILKGLDLSDPSNFGIVQQIAQTMGVNASDIIDEYKASKATYDQAQTTLTATNAKAAADLAKTIADTGSVGINNAKTVAETNQAKANTAKIYSDIANGGTYQTGGLKLGKSDLSSIQETLKNGNAQKGLLPSGKDLFANTNTYITLYNHWTDQGGLAKDFVNLFPPKTYLNPNDASMPDALKKAVNSTGITINTSIPGVTGQ